VVLRIGHGTAIDGGILASNNSSAQLLKVDEPASKRPTVRVYGASLGSSRLLPRDAAVRLDANTALGALFSSAIERSRHATRCARV